MAIAKNANKKTPEQEPKKIFKEALAITWIQFSSTTSIHGEIYRNAKLIIAITTFRSKSCQRPSWKSLHSSFLDVHSDILFHLR